jgi:hypothetical protein
VVTCPEALADFHMDIAISPRTPARTCSLPRSAPLETNLFGDEHIGKVRVKELPDTTEGKGEPQRLDENRQLVIRVPESYSHPSHDARIISMHGDIGPIESLQPQYQRDVGNITELRAQITLEVEQRLALSRNETFDNRSPAKLTSIRTDTEESKRSSISTFITAKSFRSSVETFRTANTGLHSITWESTVSRFSTFLWKIYHLEIVFLLTKSQQELMVRVAAIREFDPGTLE